MPAYLTAEMAAEAIGLYVVEHQKTGPASSAGWACPAKLKRVISDTQCVVQPNGHLREEITEISKLRLWMKGNHQLGEHAMSRATAIDAVADLQAKVRSCAIRSVTHEDARNWLGNGENPLVLCRITKKDKTAAMGRLIGMRGENFMVRMIGGSGLVLDYEPDLVGIPDGIELDQLDYNLLEKAFTAELGKRVPDKSGDALKAVRMEVPAPTKPTTPAPGTIPFPVRAPANAEPPREPKPVGKGEWVIVDRKSRTFWSSDPSNPMARDWVRELDKARVYDTAAGVNSAAGRLDKQEGLDPEAMSLKQARFFYDLWYRPSRLAQVEAETRRIEAAKPPEPVPAQTMSHDGDHAEGEGRIGPDASKDRLADAIRNRCAAEVMLLEAKSKEAIARAEYEIDRL